MHLWGEATWQFGISPVLDFSLNDELVSTPKWQIQSAHLILEHSQGPDVSFEIVGL
jgi:hypothetical protein